jgi:hypothetical protein
VVDLQNAALLLRQSRIAGAEARQQQTRCEDRSSGRLHRSLSLSVGEASECYHDQPAELCSGDRGRRLKLMMPEIEAKRLRLTAVERELARLGVRHELAMSAFKFDEARQLQQRIAVLEHERAELVAALPVPAPPPSAVPAPVTVQRRRPVRRRRPLRR